MVDRRGKPIVPGQPQQIGKFGHRFRGEGGFSGGKPFGGQKNLSGRAGIVTGGSEQMRIAQRGLVLAAPYLPDRDGSTFEGLAAAPAAGPDGFGADKIVERFQGDAGGEGCCKLVRLAAARQGPAGQGGREYRRGDERVTGESMTAIL